jgi:hypothetical protein
MIKNGSPRWPADTRPFWIVAMTETYRSVLNETVSSCIASTGGANHPTASFQDRVAAPISASYVVPPAIPSAAAPDLFQAFP